MSEGDGSKINQVYPVAALACHLKVSSNSKHPSIYECKSLSFGFIETSLRVPAHTDRFPASKYFRQARRWNQLLRGTL
jgi:hypothetical protein